MLICSKIHTTIIFYTLHPVPYIPKHQYSYLVFVHVAHKFDNSLRYTNNAIRLHRKLKLLFDYLQILFLNINTIQPQHHAHAHYHMPRTQASGAHIIVIPDFRLKPTKK